MARSSLGPFPKTRHLKEMFDQGSSEEFVQIVRNYLATEGQRDLRGILTVVTLVLATRQVAPSKWLAKQISKDIPAQPTAEDLKRAFTVQTKGSLSQMALADIIESVMATPADTLFDTDIWNAWRRYDGSKFCDLAKAFYAEYLGIVLAELAPPDIDGPALKQFAFEAATITRAFSARWFNACARFDSPDEGSVRWYLKHCLGKLDLEMERERIDWIEPKGSPWSRRRRTTEAGFETVSDFFL